MSTTTLSSSEAGPPPSADPVLGLIQSLWALSHALDTMSKRMDATLGVTGPQRLALLTLANDPGITAVELSQRLRIHPSTTTGLLDRLVRKGLVRRERSAEDRRTIAIFVTGTGVSGSAPAGRPSRPSSAATSTWGPVQEARRSRRASTNSPVA